MRGALGAALLLFVAGCASPGKQCPLASQQPMAITELFFGRDIQGRAPLTETEWSAFVASTIAKEFPDGFTVLDGNGEWRDPATNAVASERTKVLLVATQGEVPAERIERVIDAYKHAYAQRSVGVLTHSACGAFGE